MSSVKLLQEIACSFKGNIQAKTIYHKYWLLNCLMQEAFAGSFKNIPFQFPENAKWFSNLSTPTFLYDNIYNKNSETKLYKNIRIVVGDLEISKKRWKFFELKPNCSCLYFIKDGIVDSNSLDSQKSNPIDWVDEISDMMKLIYEGLEDKKTSKIPDKLGYFEIQQFNIHFKFLQKKELKKEFKIKLSSSFFNRPDRYQFISLEELEWIKNNYEYIIDKIDFQLFTWEQLIANIENTETRKDFEQFYKKCMITLYYL